jgi:hypothetical protein
MGTTEVDEILEKALTARPRESTKNYARFDYIDLGMRGMAMGSAVELAIFQVLHDRGFVLIAAPPNGGLICLKRKMPVGHEVPEIKITGPGPESPGEEAERDVDELVNSLTPLERAAIYAKLAFDHHGDIQRDSTVHHHLSGVIQERFGDKTAAVLANEFAGLR